MILGKEQDWCRWQARVHFGRERRHSEDALRSIRPHRCRTTHTRTDTRTRRKREGERGGGGHRLLLGSELSVLTRREALRFAAAGTFVLRYTPRSQHSNQHHCSTATDLVRPFLSLCLELFPCVTTG